MSSATSVSVNNEVSFRSNDRWHGTDDLRCIACGMQRCIHYLWHNWWVASNILRIATHYQGQKRIRLLAAIYFLLFRSIQGSSDLSWIQNIWWMMGGTRSWKGDHPDACQDIWYHSRGQVTFPWYPSGLFCHMFYQAKNLVQFPGRISQNWAFKSSDFCRENTSHCAERAEGRDSRNTSVCGDWIPFTAAYNDDIRIGLLQGFLTHWSKVHHVFLLLYWWTRRKLSVICLNTWHICHKKHHEMRAGQDWSTYAAEEMSWWKLSVRSDHCEWHLRIKTRTVFFASKREPNWILSPLASKTSDSSTWEVVCWSRGGWSARDMIAYVIVTKPRLSPTRHVESSFSLDAEPPLYNGGRCPQWCCPKQYRFAAGM